jgi:heavy metal sensor kinase
MWVRSLRARLALWQAGLLALTLLALSALTLVLLRTVLSSRLDGALADYAEKTAANVATTLYQSSVHGGREPDRFFTSAIRREWGRELQLVDARTGNRRDWTPGLADQRLPTDLDERLNAARGVPTFKTRTNLGEFPVRVVTYPVHVGKDVPYMVQAAESLGGVEEALERASSILLVLTPSVLLLALIGGWLLVGRSLHPVDEMTRAALAMEPGKLAHRIEAPGNDDEIARLADAFNQMLERLDRSFRQIQQFSADASHELKTPLTSIRGAAEVALMGERDPEEYRRALRSIVDDVERMSAIVENLLLLARADANQVRIKSEPVEFQDLVLGVYEQLEPLGHRKGVALDLSSIDEVTVAGDPLWLNQIAVNLVNNAIKYTPEGGTVTLSLRADGAAGTAEFSVSDTGPGIPPEHLPRIFDRFYRVDSGRSRDAGGVGLGLNIAKWAAEAQGGRIEVKSQVGVGTTFTLTMPTAGPPLSAASTPVDTRKE